MEKRDRREAGERSRRPGRHRGGKRTGASPEKKYSAVREQPGREEEAGQESLSDGLIEGRNAVTEALRSGATIDKIYVSRGDTDRTLSQIVALAKQAGIVVADADHRKLDAMSCTHAHQGVIAVAAVREYASVEEILRIAEEKGEAPLLVVCDELSDPHNLGAVIRTAECAGAHGVIIPKRRSAGLTAVVAKTSAGADGDTDLYHADLKGPAAIVIGSEGDGMSRLVAQGCDFLVSIPMKGKISSLNASAAAAILLYEAVRQRMG